jgi:hypothetical protein
MSVYMSLRCKFCFQRLYIWNCSNVLFNGPFFSKCSMSIVSCMLLYVCISMSILSIIFFFLFYNAENGHCNTFDKHSTGSTQPREYN